MTVVALVRDLMDRSRILAAVPDVEMIDDAASAAGADVVIIDLAHAPDALPAVRAAAPDGFIVAYGAHVDDDTLEQARADGADRVLPRSRFFRDPGAALTPT
jgi:DNA-binding NarL/FixJ family response regulator